MVRITGQGVVPREQDLRVVPVSEDSLRPADPDAAQKIQKAYTRLPLRFEKNLGQAGDEIKYLARTKGHTVLFDNSKITFILSRPAPAKPRRQSLRDINFTDPEHQPEPVVLHMEFIGANPDPSIVGLQELSGKTNYLIGSDPKKWQTDVASYASVLYEGVYPGIDLYFYGNQRQLEYDFRVAPGADPESIQLRFDGAEEVNIDESGELILHTAHGEIRQHKPQIYQEIDGVRKPISGRYTRKGRNIVAGKP